MAIRRIIKVIRGIREFTPIIGDKLFGATRTETEVLPNGQTQTYQSTGLFRSRTVLTATATILIGIFNWQIDAGTLTETLLHVVEAIGGILTIFFRERTERVIR